MVNHFNNANRRVSLKSLEFAMRLESVEDLPFPIRDLSSDEMDTLIKYNAWDVIATEEFFKHCQHAIKMREDLRDTGVLTGDVLNYSDVKIGVEYLIKKIGRSKCFVKGSTPKQSIRESIAFAPIILPHVQFRSEEYQQVRDWFSQQVVRPDVKETKPKLSKKLAGVDFHFGLGGVHASVNNKVYKDSDTHMIMDIDVTGMYVSVAIANDFAPEHLGKDFSLAYAQLKRDRGQYKKGTPMNATLKLAGNGVYGNSNNKYSCFRDPKYLYTVTANGQLQLLQIVETLALIPGLEVIQANTDGITVYMRRDLYHFFKMWVGEWEKMTGLVMEYVEYQTMHISNVNHYLAVTTDGKIKRKGKYWYPEKWSDYDGVWNKDFSNLSAAKVASQVMLNGGSIADTLMLVTDPFDFMLRYKTPGGATVYLGDKPMSKTVRYYVSTAGQPMRKVAKPKGEIGQYKRKNKLTDAYWEKIMGEIGPDVWDERVHNKKKSKYEIVTTSIQSGRLIKECNLASKFDWSDVDWDYYIKEIEKLIIGDSHV
jgi:hypothetical protein